MSSLEIDLRHHEDGSYMLEIRTRGGKSDINITGIIHDIVVDKIRYLQKKLEISEKYKDWMLSSTTETHESLTTLKIRYDSIYKRLSLTTEAVSELVSSWEEGKESSLVLKNLRQVLAQNESFLEEDLSLQKESGK